MKRAILMMMWLAIGRGDGPSTGSLQQAVPVPVDEPRGGGGGGGDAPAPTCMQATLHGNVFYNDQRRYGRFPLRYDKNDDPGVQ